MYLFFSPAIAALVAIAVIQIRDQFRFSVLQNVQRAVSLELHFHHRRSGAREMAQYELAVFERPL